jgi:hypothetical protein
VFDSKAAFALTEIEDYTTLRQSAGQQLHSALFPDRLFHFRSLPLFPTRDTHPVSQRAPLPTLPFAHGLSH